MDPAWRPTELTLYTKVCRVVSYCRTTYTLSIQVVRLGSLFAPGNKRRCRVRHLANALRHWIIRCVAPLGDTLASHPSYLLSISAAPYFALHHIKRYCNGTRTILVCRRRRKFVTHVAPPRSELSPSLCSGLAVCLDLKF